MTERLSAEEALALSKELNREVLKRRLKPTYYCFNLVDYATERHMMLSTTVGEHQGESQHPPESLRIGKRCVLVDTPISNEDVADPVVGKFIHYFPTPPR